MTGLTVGILDISFYAVVGEIVVERLRRDGHTVAVVRAQHGGLFPLLANGDIDVLVLAWLPDGHRPLWDDFGGETYLAHTAYKGARFFWALTPPAGAGLRRIEDLRTTPAAMVGRRILTVGPSSSITARSRLMLDRYGLTEAGFRVEVSDTEGQETALAAALADGRCEVFALWVPSFITALHGAALRELEEPRGVLGGANDATIVLSGEYASRVTPDVLGCLRSIRLSLDQVATMDVELHRGRPLPELAAAWLDAPRSEREHRSSPPTDWTLSSAPPPTGRGPRHQGPAGARAPDRRVPP